jgi:hypothetical protein
LDAEGIGTLIADGEGIGSQIGMHNMAIDGLFEETTPTCCGLAVDLMPWL